MTQPRPPTITGIADAQAALSPIFEGQEREHFVAIWLDRRHRPIGSPEVLSIGSDSATVVDPRYVLRRALLANAVAMIVAHNHPSGESVPSVYDTTVTHKLREACDVVGVELLDHLIFGDSWYSFAEHGLIRAG